MKEVTINVVGSDSFLYPDFLKNGSIRQHTEIEISKGVSLRFDSAIFCESVDAPTFIQISVIIGREVLLPIALGLVSTWLYDKIKEKKAYKISINGIAVELDKQKIMDLLKQELKEKPPLEQHLFKLIVPEIEKKELRLSARTLSQRQIVFDGIELPYSDNKVDFADYNSGGIKTYLVIRDEVLNAILKKRIILYAVAETELTPSNHKIFTKLILTSKRIPSSHKIQYINT